MRNLSYFLSCTLLLSVFLFSSPNLGRAQCVNTASGGQSGCARSSFFYGEILPDLGCGTFRSISGYGPGQYFRMPVLEGGCYTVSTCGTGVDTQINCFEGSTTTVFAYDDDNGPMCGGFAASVNMVPSFTDYARIDVREYPCSAGGSASITVFVRQNNNLAFTSSSSNMCEGSTLTVSAVPAPVTGAFSGAGDQGSLTGTGLSGNTFTAPTPSGGSATYTLTYTFGYCSTNQSITVFRDPSVADAGSDIVVCSGTASLSAIPPGTGSGQWSVLSGPGSIASPSSPSTSISGLVQGATTVVRWRVSNGPCASNSDSLTISRDVDPTIASCGPDVNVCLDSLFLSANSPSIGNGVWTLASGAGIIQSPSNPTSMVTSVGLGPNTFIWTISNGVCVGTSDTLVITRDTQSSQAFAGPDKQICGPNTAMAGNLPSVGSGLWTIISGSGVLSNPNQPNATVTGMNLGNTSLTWTISNGTCPSRSDTILVTRNPVPSPPVVTGSQNVCFGFPATLTANSSANTPTYTWWDAATGGNLLAAGNIYNSPLLGSAITVYCEVTDGVTSCASSRAQFSVNVNALPVVNLGTDSIFCSNNSVCLDAGPGLASYSWNAGPTSQVFCTNVSGTYWVDVVNSSGCTGSDTVNLLANTPPVVNLGPDVTLCTGSQYTIGVPNVTGNNYSWNTSDTTNNLSVIVGGTYSITVTDINGCQNSDQLEVNQYDVPVAAFAVDTSNCPTIAFADQSTDASSWIWSFGNGASSFIQNPNYNYQTSGNNGYTITLIVNGICGADTITESINIDCIVGLQMPDNLSITVYPNPNDGLFKIHFDGLNQDVEFRVFNDLGQQVYAKTIVGQSGAFDELVNLQGVAAGTYFAKLKIGDAVVTKRILVQ